MIFLVEFLVCLAASTVGGICGIGGGVVIKPVLDAMGVMPVATLSFLSGLTVLLMAVVNVWKNRRSNALDKRRSIPLAIGAALGGLIGKQMFQTLKNALDSDRMAGLVQAVVLGLLVLGTLIYVQQKARVHSRSIQHRGLGAAVGTALGMLSAFLGIGGGPMNLAVLYYFFSMDTKQAAVNSILIILISQTASLFMTLATASVPAFDWRSLVAMSVAGILGGFLSARLHRKLSARQTDALFKMLLVVILLICAWNAGKNGWG